jgi:hypothetical protein
MRVAVRTFPIKGASFSIEIKLNTYLLAGIVLDTPAKYAVRP